MQRNWTNPVIYCVGIAPNIVGELLTETTFTHTVNGKRETITTWHLSAGVRLLRDSVAGLNGFTDKSRSNDNRIKCHLTFDAN